MLVRDVLAEHADLFAWFKQFIGFDDSSVPASDPAAAQRAAADKVKKKKSINDFCVNVVNEF